MYLLTIILLRSTADGQVLQARKAGVSLPYDLAYSTAVFDDEDCVYIFGGYTFCL
jgi:hypothetical protein